MSMTLPKLVPVQEIRDAATDPETNVIDLLAARDMLVEALTEAGVPLTPLESIVAHEMYVDKVFRHVAALVLEIADELGALPKGVELETENLSNYREYAKAETVYEYVIGKVEMMLEEQGNQLVIPDGPRLVVPE